MNGSESFELSNALSGGEWFVDINYLDKTDSVSYAPVAQGYAYSNKSDYLYSTVYNGSRHVSMTTTKFHEGYSSGGEIIYRRKSLTGSWETTQRISAGDGNSNDPFVLNAHDGSIHIVWQKYLTSTSYRLLYSRSTNGGTTWIGPTTLISSVPINSAQYNIYPVLAEWNSSKLVLVYCVNTGLKYLTSSNLGMNWTGPTSISGSGGSYAGSIWFPSLSSGPGYVILTYDTRYSGVFSHAYNGTSWLTEASVNAGTGTRFDRYSSVAYDPGSGAVYASWCAQGPELAEYMILTRSGTSYGTWGSGFVQFAKTPGASNLYPSITPWQEPGVSRNIDIIYQNTINQVKLNQYFEASGWQSPRLLSSSGQWANIPQITDMSTTLYPIRIWTDQTASPYQVVLSTDGSYPLNANISEWAPAAEPFNREWLLRAIGPGPQSHLNSSRFEL